jgi:hypothetical protein
MKNLIILAVMCVLFLSSCGRRNVTRRHVTTTPVCRTQSDMILACIENLQYNYGMQYAVDFCNYEYRVNRCY